MNNSTIIIKTKQRLNKLASNDYDNIETWQILEAFNKGTVAWCRRNLHGLNVKQTGDEQSKSRIDDLQILLNTISVIVQKRDGFFTTSIPENYFEWKRISAKGSTECCSKPRPLIITLAEEANVDEINRDFLKKPSFEWSETYCTITDNEIHIHTNNEFEVEDVKLTYYRQPIRVEMLGVINTYTGIAAVIDTNSEFKDDLVELFIDETVKILAGDIESFNQVQTATGQVEGNN